MCASIIRTIKIIGILARPAVIRSRRGGTKNMDYKEEAIRRIMDLTDEQADRFIQYLETHPWHEEKPLPEHRSSAERD